MYKLIIYFALVLTPLISFSQKEDNNWIFGVGQYDLPGNIYRLNHIQFTNDTFKVKLLNRNFPFFTTCSIISDSSGNLLCYTNGLNLYNKNHSLLFNGNDFQSSSQFPYGYPFDRSVLILPLPDSPLTYIMIDGSHVDIGIDIITTELRYSLIDFSLQSGNGGVTLKKVIINNSTDTLNVGLLSSVRHSNGIDWWVLTTKFESNHYRKFIITGKGIEFHDDQIIGDTVHNGLGTAVFSPSGCWYSRYLNYGKAANPDGALYLYRFDRTTGELSAPIYKHFPQPEYFGGVAFSPNSRFLYVSKFLQILQYDLQASDILASETVVAEYDGFLDENGVPTRFYGLQLAPDNKIYGNIPGFNTRYLHVIDQPNLPGAASNVIQHAIYLPAQNFGTLPNLPYFRLGPAEISCDSLISATATTAPGQSPVIRVWPVPAVDVLYFSADVVWEEPLHLVLFDAYGRIVLERRDLRLSPTATVTLEELPSGPYFYGLLQRNGQIVKSGKIIRTR
jgi:hypothetical protein